MTEIRSVGVKFDKMGGVTNTTRYIIANNTDAANYSDTTSYRDKAS